MPICYNNYEQVDAPILRMILKWCEHHKDDDTNRRIDYVRTPFYALPPIDEWDQSFMSVDLDTLFEITIVSSPPLPHISNKKAEPFPSPIWPRTSSTSPPSKT